MESADDLRLLVEAAAIGGELLAHGPVVGNRVLRRAVDQMEQHAAALDMAEEAVAEAGALVRPLDQAGDVGEDEFAAVDGARRRAPDAAW